MVYNERSIMRFKTYLEESVHVYKVHRESRVRGAPRVKRERSLAPRKVKPPKTMSIMNIIFDKNK